MPGIFKAPFWCVVSVCEKVWEPIFFRIVWLSDWRRRLVSWVVLICSCVSSNTKLPVAHLSVAMSCDEKNNKRRKKRSKQSSEANSHAPKSVENREVCRPNIKHTQCSFHYKKKGSTLSEVGFRWCTSVVLTVIFYFRLALVLALVVCSKWNVCFSLRRLSC